MKFENIEIGKTFIFLPYRKTSHQGSCLYKKLNNNDFINLPTGIIFSIDNSVINLEILEVYT